jgi:hypothetical protein
MRVEREWLRSVIFGRDTLRRFTQDSPILPEVWLIAGIVYGIDRTKRVDLLLSPHKERTAGTLGRVLQQRLQTTPREPRAVKPEGGNEMLITRPVWTLSVSQVAVAVSLTLDELITAALPLTPWWKRNAANLEAMVEQPSADDRSAEVKWMRRIVGILELCSREKSPGGRQVDSNAPWVGNQHVDDEDAELELPNDLNDLESRSITRATIGEYRTFLRIARDDKEQRKAFAALVKRAFALGATDKKDVAKDAPPLLWSIGLNRRAKAAIDKSVSSTKADAARRVFNVSCADIAWAVVDTGIDRTHGAFIGEQWNPVTRKKEPTNRVKGTYDFTRLRALITLDSHPSTGPSAVDEQVDLEVADREFKAMRQRLRSGRALDWARLEPLLRVQHAPKFYRVPEHDHGTHVAGILGGCKVSDEHREGMCPDIQLYDFRVLDAQGKGDEFSIIAALQFIRYLNAVSDQPVIHGVNLSLSLLHDVENFACGRTPICEECERLVATGVVVVAAAGNRGFERVLTGAGELDAYRAISITDPGNAESVITVGATHRFQPHTYGVSYFSSRGPTGDGRIKPDVLAPGERVYSALPNKGYGAKDGTSMAAPHVSGVAAMLMARHREFLGQPARIKNILMKTATDLGRERYFQGAGMVDALRALQAV